MIAEADPFASPPPRADIRQAAPAAMTASAIAGPAHVGTTHVGQGGAGPSLSQEITVIVDSRDPAKPKQVIVIPRPSPWLLQVLTGESPVVEAGMTTARNANLRGPAPQLAARKPLQRVQAFPVAGP